MGVPDDIPCQCEKLRSCEQRVRNEVFDGHHRYYQQVRTDAMAETRADMARELAWWEQRVADAEERGRDAERQAGIDREMAVIRRIDSDL
jgi:hypothetical protein